MELMLLGTGAAEGYPAIACGCRNCEAARARGGRNLRKRAHAIVDRALLIDLGPDLLWSVHQHGLALHHLRYVLLTHGHDDHLMLSNVDYRGPGFAPGEIARWDLRGSAASIKPILELPGYGELRLEARPVAAFETFDLGPYTVTALRARHAPDLEPLFYAIRRGDSALLYATDSGPWFDETWAALEQLGRDGVRFGAVVIEATSGVIKRAPGAEPAGHMTFDEMSAHARGLRERGLLASNATVLATHFSHNGAPPHEETTAILAPEGIQTAFDGMVVEV